ncbi:hypothetical protein BU26DRAFT_161484 [Trematosphaeria pertusa]|uniref:Secreted protein n=1 Tax=Trematosphaeria pertusa TaxID=390896 RepID=A0A6A6HW81_9PLEO|nr:uncharacterized protein BU26DRAFT_161484 [Trematosphaeria pertusa]KAF2242464.1 hypothetical protein BU26DRAFT_161484 [Trematosphaeria pertusa]
MTGSLLLPALRLAQAFPVLFVPLPKGRQSRFAKAELPPGPSGSVHMSLVHGRHGHLALCPHAGDFRETSDREARPPTPRSTKYPVAIASANMRCRHR